MLHRHESVTHIEKLDLDRGISFRHVASTKVWFQ